jgi:Zn-dependent alcohol dehydrogenase
MVIANSLCHSDVNVMDGTEKMIKFPVILGHEATGIVESIGEGVTSVQVGDTIIPVLCP